MNNAQPRYETLVRELRYAEVAFLTAQIDLEKFVQEYRASLAGRQVQHLAINRIPDRSVRALVEQYVEALPADTFFTNDDIRQWCEITHPQELARFKRGLYLALGKMVFDNRLERAGTDGFRVIAQRPTPLA